MSEEKLMSKKKPAYPINKELDEYLQYYNRKIEIPIHYDDLLRFSGSVAVYDAMMKIPFGYACFIQSLIEMKLTSH